MSGLIAAPAAWTYGAELEWPDVDVTAELRPGWKWSSSDYTIVNSDGVANDPRRKLILRGGELNTPPATGPDTLAEEVAEQWKRSRPGHNYRSNLHIHVRIAGISERLPLLLRIAEFSRSHLPQLWPHVDPLGQLLSDQGDSASSRGAEARLRHSERSRHHFVTPERHAARSRAETLEGFLAAEVPEGRDGRPAWALGPREAVNLRSLRKHDTIEFRCFADPADPGEVHAAAAFAGLWLYLALYGGSALEAVQRWGPLLPRQRRFDLRLEKGWRETNLQHNKRGDVEALLRSRGQL